MTDAEYLRALYPDRYRVAGVWLKPYSLGHVFLLDRIGSPFVEFEREAKLGDLRVALALCKRDYKDALRWLRRGAGRWSMPLRWCSQRNFLEGVAQFADYITKSFTHPDSWTGEGRRMGAPFFQSVKLTLMMHLGMSEAQAMACPLSLAMWDYMACWELKDRMQLVSGTDRQAMNLAKMLAEKRN